LCDARRNLDIRLAVCLTDDQAQKHLRRAEAQRKPLANAIRRGLGIDIEQAAGQP
jgi:hypothetical protein